MTKVLITKNITATHLKLLVDAELDYTVCSAVKFDISYKTNVVIQAIKTGNDWIFTSVNAVKAIHLLLTKYQKKFEQKIYCVGNPAYTLLTQLGYFSVTKFDTEKALSESIDWMEDKTYTYFCNNNLRNIIPEKISAPKAAIEYIEVYTSTLKNPKIQDVNYDYVLFFSPLAVKSILRKNPQLKSCHAICIGPATERIVRDQGVQKYSMPPKPTLRSMVEMIVES